VKRFTGRRKLVHATKWIELVREMVPALDRIAFAWQPSTGRSQLDVALGVAKTLNIEATVLEFDISDDFAASLSDLTGPKQTGVIQVTFPGITTVAEKFAAAAERYHLPTISFLRFARRTPKPDNRVAAGLWTSVTDLQRENVIASDCCAGVIHNR
jgi:hypothetical protein